MKKPCRCKMRMGAGCCILALGVLVTSCCPPIWSRLKKRAGVSVSAAHDKAVRLIFDDFTNVSRNWVEEAEGNVDLHYSEADRALDVKASQGLTLWYRKPLGGNLRITYEALVVDRGENLDRGSDLNCFWMASDPIAPDSLFSRKEFRQGATGRYYSLQLYAMSIGGNSNTSTYFSRYDGRFDAFHNRMKRPPRLVEYRDEAHLLKPNHWYSIEITVKEGRVRYIQDGEMLVDYVDSLPLRKGWFGIRTAENHIRIRNFAVYKY